MEFKIGDRVNVLNFYGPEKKGTITKESKSWYQGQITRAEYGVVCDGEAIVSYYQHYDLQLVPPTACTCGADATYRPAKPPGHAVMCDVTLDSENRDRFLFET